ELLHPEDARETVGTGIQIGREHRLPGGAVAARAARGTSGAAGLWSRLQPPGPDCAEADRGTRPGTANARQSRSARIVCAFSAGRGSTGEGDPRIRFLTPVAGCCTSSSARAARNPGKLVVAQ